MGYGFKRPIDVVEGTSELRFRIPVECERRFEVAPSVRVCMFVFIQSGMMTARRSSWMLMSRALASLFNIWKFASPREKMNFAMDYCVCTR